MLPWFHYRRQPRSKGGAFYLGIGPKMLRGEKFFFRPYTCAKYIDAQNNLPFLCLA